MALEQGLELYSNKNIQDVSGTSFPSATGGSGLTINGTYTTDSKGVVLSGTDNTLKTSGDITFQTVSLWFRFNDIIPSFNLFDSLGDSGASFTATTVVTQARSSNLGLTTSQSAYMYAARQSRFDPNRGTFMHNISKQIRETPSSGSVVSLNLTSSSNVEDFDYRFPANQYCSVALDASVETSIAGVISTLTPIWAGTARCVRYRESDDKFIVMIEGSSDQVCMLDGDTGVFTSIYSNTGITIAPRTMAVNGDIMYFIASDSHIYSLDISSSSNVPVQITTATVGTTQSLNYYRQKLYTMASGTLVEIQETTGQQFVIYGIPSQWFVYAMDFKSGYVYAPKSDDFLQKFGYDFNGSDGRSYTLTEGTNVVSNTYINGESVTSLEDMINYSYGGLNNVVFTLTSPTTSTLTLFGNSANANSPDVTVEAVSVYSSVLTAQEVSYTYAAYLDDNSSLPGIRYNKIVLSNDDWLHLSEFELYDSNGTNIALLGTASQTSQFQSSVASISINGFNDGTIAPGDTYNFSSTQGAGDWTLVLDKGYARSDLSYITAYNRITPSQSERDRAIGITITLYSIGDAYSEQIGVFNGDEIQTFVITEKVMALTPGVTTMKVDVTEVDGALAYRVDLFETSTGKRVFRRLLSTIDTSYTTDAQTLTPNTSYTGYLYVDTGNGLELNENTIVETLVNSLSNYDINEYGGNGNFDLSSLGTDGVSLIDEFLNDLFTTGDNIELNLIGTPLEKKSTFVNRGSTVAIDGAEALVAPFDQNAGAGQEITMTLSNNTTSVVSYDETTNSVTVESNSYSPGDSFILDGKKVVVFDL